MSQDLPNRLATAMALLRQSAIFADSLQQSRWEFAVELRELKGLGLTHSDLRYLISCGHIEHADEVTTARSSKRRFTRLLGLQLSERTCFVLSPHEELAESAVDVLHPSQIVVGRTMSTNRSTMNGLNQGGCKRCGALSLAIPNAKPLWDKERCCLILDGFLVKTFHSPARNQWLILTTFQEREWPVRIDDPLPSTVGIDPKTRLHQTIASLNRCQQNGLLRFCGDGTGRGVRWTAGNQDVARRAHSQSG